jgi:hypothetical protein
VAGATGRGSGGGKEDTAEWRPRRGRRRRIEELDDGGLGAARGLVHGGRCLSERLRVNSAHGRHFCAPLRGLRRSPALRTDRPWISMTPR